MVVIILLADEGGSNVTSRDGVERQDAAVCCECLIKTDIKLLISSAVRVLMFIELLLRGVAYVSKECQISKRLIPC